MKIVKQISTGKIVYRSIPEFEAGMGIKNAVAINGGKPEDYIEMPFFSDLFVSEILRKPVLDPRGEELGRWF